MQCTGGNAPDSQPQTHLHNCAHESLALKKVAKDEVRQLLGLLACLVLLHLGPPDFLHLLLGVALGGLLVADLQRRWGLLECWAAAAGATMTEGVQPSFWC